MSATKKPGNLPRRDFCSATNQLWTRGRSGKSPDRVVVELYRVRRDPLQGAGRRSALVAGSGDTFVARLIGRPRNRRFDSIVPTGASPAQTGRETGRSL